MNEEAADPPLNPVIGAMLRSARDFLTHEHSLFRSLGLKPILIGRGRTSFSVDLPAAFSESAAAVHGGLHVMILDSIMGLTVFTALDEIKPIATINLRVDQLRAAAPGARAICACECAGIIDEIAFVSGRLTLENGGDLLSLGEGAFMVGTRGPAKGSRL
jgi:acyl-coenzyme A thioesterase PaaI-like protein